MFAWIKVEQFVHPSLCQTMKAYVVNQWLKGPEELKIQDIDVPVLKQGEVQVQVMAAGLNFFDTLIIQGRHQTRPTFPYIPGRELAGIVIKSTVPEFKPGDRVFGSGAGYGEIANVEDKKLFPLPKSFSFELGAAAFANYSTGYAALVVRARIKPGEYCLIHAAAGGVGIAAVQLAKILGATVIATAGSTEKLEFAKKHGADYVINYADEDWPKQVMKLTNGHGADVVFDPVGLVEKSTKCIAWDGRVVIIGFAKGAIEKVAMNRILVKNIALTGIHWGEYVKKDIETYDLVWKNVLDLFESGKLRPVLYHNVYSFDDIPKGLEAINSRSSYGKVVATFNQSQSRI
ncbi:hypothetical protein BC940DRAFT_293287 [Gongronella butleri]|nr:hypothetical protein BC940DRAFT_293287 [Gongronella butleri]